MNQDQVVLKAQLEPNFILANWQQFKTNTNIFVTQEDLYQKSLIFSEDYS